jgi:hypothetical protein
MTKAFKPNSSNMVFTLESHIVDLFDHVICFGFPYAWYRHIIHLILKLGAKLDLNIYLDHHDLAYLLHALHYNSPLIAF